MSFAPVEFAGAGPAAVAVANPVVPAGSQSDFAPGFSSSTLKPEHQPCDSPAPALPSVDEGLQSSDGGLGNHDMATESNSAQLAGILTLLPVGLAPRRVQLCAGLGGILRGKRPLVSQR